MFGRGSFSLPQDCALRSYQMAARGFVCGVLARY